MSAYSVRIGDRTFSVTLTSRVGSTLSFVVDGKAQSVTLTPVPRRERGPGAGELAASGVLITELKAPMPGIVSDVKTQPGQSVQKGDTLIVIEAMKMENPIRSPRDGVIRAVAVAKGEEVRGGAVLIEFER